MATATKTRVDLGTFAFDRPTKNFVRYVNDEGITQYVAKAVLDGAEPDEIRLTLEF